MSSHDEDFDLLLSLQDRVLETPPGSPSASHGSLSDDALDRGPTDMSDFLNVVQDCLDGDDLTPTQKAVWPQLSKSIGVANFEKFSGLRIRNQLLSSAEISEHFSDVRFVRLPTIKNLIKCDTLSGCWATIGVLIEKGNPKTSSIGHTYAVWKIGCLDETSVSLFLFGDAYKQHWKAKEGTVFGFFRCSLRKENKGLGFSLSVSAAGQVIELGNSVDYGVCKGKRKDGMACTSSINKRVGAYCKFHRLNAREKFSTKRAELKGGNLRTMFRGPLTAEGVHAVDPSGDRTDFKSCRKPAKILSVDGLRKTLSNAGRVTTNAHSQGIRFLHELTGSKDSIHLGKEEGSVVQQTKFCDKRKLASSFNSKPFTAKRNLDTQRSREPDLKRKKNETGQNPIKMIVLDYCSSDGEI